MSQTDLRQTRADAAGRVLEALSVAVLVATADLRVAYVNSAAEVLLGASRVRVSGRALAELLPDVTDVISHVDTVIESGQTVTVRELQLRPASARTESIPVDLTIAPFRWQGRPGVLFEMDRIDGLSHAARERHARARQETNRAVLRGLAHEIKNPLGGLRGAAQLLDRELRDRELREYTRIITHEADRLTRLVDRMMASNPRHQPGPVNIHEVMEYVRRLMAVEAGPGIRFRVDYDPSLPVLQGDREALVQVVLNIIRNAVEALGGKGLVTLRTRIARQMTVAGRRHRQLICVDVIDDGPGVPEALGSQIFEPMVTGRADGIGLGLAIAQDIVVQHGGLLEFESRAGETCFRMVLPLR